jgi:8-oxo-dGTP diphosphatase
MKHYCAKCGKSAVQRRPSLIVCEDGHENWVNPPVGSIAFVLRDRKVLYGVRSREPGMGKLCPPGGMIEVGDNAEQTAVREAKEELGADITLTDFLGSYTSTYGDRSILNLVFVAKTSTDRLVPADDMSGGEPVWCDIEDLPSTDEVASEWMVQAQKDLLTWWRRSDD